MATLLSVSYRSLYAFQPRDLAMMAWGFARLNVAVPHEYLAAFERRLEVLAAQFTPQVGARSKSGMGKVDEAWGGYWQRRFRGERGLLFCVWRSVGEGEGGGLSWRCLTSA